MTTYLFHYTSRQLAQDIIIAGKLKPKIGRKLYLTPDIYQTGYEAKKRLSITGKSIEIVGVIPLNKIRNIQLLPSEEEPSHVEPPISIDYEYPENMGCGNEFFTFNVIDNSNII